MSSTISVQLDSLDALAGELTALAGELSDDADRCASAAGALAAGLNRDEGLTAAWAGRRRGRPWPARWPRPRTPSGATLGAAVSSYRAAEAARAESIGRRRLEYVAVAW